MSEDKRGFFAKIFLAMMIFTALVWVWTVAFIISWPWDKSSTWKPEFRLVATCANNAACGFAYGELAEAKANGSYVSLNPPEPAGDLEEATGLAEVEGRERHHRGQSLVLAFPDHDPLHG